MLQYSNLFAYQNQAIRLISSWAKGYPYNPSISTESPYPGTSVAFHSLADLDSRTSPGRMHPRRHISLASSLDHPGWHLFTCVM